MNYPDHLTKIVLLRTLKSKRAKEIAFNLIDIDVLIFMRGDVKIDHDKPRHDHSLL